MINDNSPSLEVKIYRDLEEAIITGKYEPGTPLTEIRLSHEFNVSRTPVREALHRLEKDGLIELIPNKGAVVRGISRSDLIDIYSIRKRLEGFAAATAAKNITDDDIARLEDIVDMAEFYSGRNNMDKLKDLDTDFHEYIYQTSGSRILKNVLVDLHRSIGAYRKLSMSTPNRLTETTKEHKAIFEAIKAHDSELADKLAAAH
ncbi:MAG: GntR family transcriptional regulator, partial [Clostridia bacterium]|nr:GntR family transcriptional regulator [Clostridia bacterium]